MVLPYTLIEGYDATQDVPIAAALDHLAAMIGVVLAYRGLNPRYSHSLPPEQVPLDPDSGPVAVHLAGAQPTTFTVYDSCIVEALYLVKSYYFITPLQDARADAWAKTMDWLVPICRAMFANQTLGGTVERIVPIDAQFVGEMEYGSLDAQDPALFTGLVITSHLYINYEWTMS